MPQGVARHPRIGLHRQDALGLAARNDEGPRHRGRLHVQPRGAPVGLLAGTGRGSGAALHADRVPFVRDIDQRIQALAKQLIGKFNLLSMAARAVRQRPGERVGARFALLGKLGIQIAMRRQHPQGLRAEQGEADQKGRAEKQPA